MLMELEHQTGYCTSLKYYCLLLIESALSIVLCKQPCWRLSGILTLLHNAIMPFLGLEDLRHRMMKIGKLELLCFIQR